MARLPPLKELGKRGQTGEDALRLRGGFGNQGGPDPAIGDFAGDISFESVDLERHRQRVRDRSAAGGDWSR